MNVMNSEKTGRGGNLSRTLPFSQDYVRSWDKFILICSSPVCAILHVCKGKSNLKYFQKEAYIRKAFDFSCRCY